MKTRGAMALAGVLASVVLGIGAGESEQPWRADPQLVAKNMAAKKEFNYDEEKVPAYTLPDPLAFANGKRVGCSDEWTQARRGEVLELFKTHVFGRSPGSAPSMSIATVKTDTKALDGTATLKQLELTIRNGEKSLVIRTNYFLPNARTAPAPVFLLINNRSETLADPTRAKKDEFWPVEEVIARGYGIAAFQNSDVDPDKHDGFKDGIHGVLDSGERAPDAWGTLAAWAWGASRVLDALEKDADIDAKRVFVLGHSRGGKTALWAGATDERFALAISNESGCGGAALSRRKYGETVARINTSFPHWFCENFKKYNGKEEECPVDQHMLMALMAPRPVYVASADQDLWADPKGEYLGLYHAGPVYELFGYKNVPLEMPPLEKPVHGERVGYHVRHGKHDLLVFDWKCFMDFADKVYGKPK